ncbi:HAMP domain-containing protein [Massilia arenosa]|uniref:histidine kinase n=1 Tax=Zemynaea arenosa TaxID=2561931 RepID=A0A4Y9SGB8_9BURK|nr:ATP-binding protein [Massilia arenosa]TFW23005.1 HAMP domain-containing protein [Massilia arenosa]
MGRLFWKFFAAILLAQVAATIGVSTVFWLHAQARENEARSGLDSSHPATEHIEAAAATLEVGGPDALRLLLQRQTSLTQVLVVDETGRDILGRHYDAALLARAEYSVSDKGSRTSVRRVQASDGHSYLLFLPARRGPRPSFNPFAGGGHGPRPDMAGPPADHAPAPGPTASARVDGPAAVPGGPRGPGFGPLPRHFMPMLAALFASLVVAAALAWYFSRPIRELRNAFDAAAAGNLEPRFTGRSTLGGDELRSLGRDFDRMAGQLRNLMDGQRRLLHDVSHELRSPLARLQAAIGIAHQQPEKIDASLERIERESVRMDKLVGELLTLSRLEVSAAAPQKEDIPFMDLIDGIVEDCGFEAEQAGKQLSVSGGAVVTINGSPDLLWRAIENVVRNAIKHSPAGGAIELALEADARNVRLAVLDRGPGIREVDLKAVFQPFFRSQPESNNVDGHGLGLAIAQRVVYAHGGSIAARNRDGGGLAVDIVLPITRPI